MKKIFFITMILLLKSIVQAQSIQRSVIGSAGKTMSTSGFTLRSTVGEAIVAKASNAGYKLNQGFQRGISTSGALPVTGLEFYTKRISNTQVQLDWKTLQEINNKGFHIERKKENENNFVDMGFVSSNANGGNSSFPLQYQKLDNNNFTGNTYYRLKQEDIDGRTAYSIVRVVKGDVNKQLTMQVWPVPAVGFFNVSVNGLSKSDLIQVIDMNGRMVKQFAIQNQTQQQVSGLPAGTYFVKLASDNTVGQKVNVQ
jgi:Secretion system C-terminal sorting domain